MGESQSKLSFFRSLRFEYLMSQLIHHQPYKVCVYTLISISHMSSLRLGEFSSPVLHT